MTNILVTVPCWIDDAPKAEALIDFIYHQNQRQKLGHALVLVAPDVHPEYAERLRISADVTFEGHTMVHIPPWARSPADKRQGVNYMLYAAAKTVAERFNWPWLWLEPDCVPLKRGWLNELDQAYHGQPRRYMGTPLTLRSKDQPDAPPFNFLSRIAVYPANAITELETLCKQENFMERNSVLLDRATRNVLIQTGHYDPQTTVLREGALIYHSDKNHELLTKLRDNLVPTHSGVQPLTALERAFSAGLPPKKLDGRSKEARELKKRAFRFANT